MTTTLKALYEERGSVTKTLRQMIDTSKEEKRDFTSEQEGQFNELAEKADQLNVKIEQEERVASLEKRSSGFDAAALPDSENTEEIRQADEADVEKRYDLALGRFLRGGRDALNTEQRDLVDQAEASTDLPAEQRDLSTAGIGVVGNRRIASKISDRMAIFNGVRRAGAEVLATEDGNSFTIPTGDDITEGVLVDESPDPEVGERDPKVRNASLTAYTYTSLNINVPFQLLSDNAFNLEDYIMKKASERIGRGTSRHFLLGTGVNEPFGVVTRATEAGNVVNPQAATFGYDDLLDLKDGVDAAYWEDPSTAYIFNQSTAIDARKLRDNEGRPIYEPAFGDKGEMINGKKMVLDNVLKSYAAADIGDPLAVFGCFNKYMIRDVTKPYMIRDPYIRASKGEVRFILFSRHGGNTGDPNAFSVLAAAA